MAPTRWLRIGILQDGRIVQERLVQAGTSVTVGTSGRNTFVFPETGLPDPEHVLFEASRDGYRVHLTPQMRGKLATRGAAMSLQDAARDPGATVEDGCTSLPLTDRDRGKIRIGSVIVLFQFVDAPPQRAQALAAQDFRPRMIEEDDPVFLGFLATWSALAAILLVWVWGTPPHQFTLENAPEHLVRLERPIVAPPDDEVEPLVSDEVDTVDRQVVDDNDDDAVAQVDPPERPTDRAIRQARDEQALLEEAASHPLLIELIGQRGEADSWVHKIWGEDGPGLRNLDDALHETEGVDIAGLDRGPRGCRGCPDGPADSDALPEIGGGPDGDGGFEGPAVLIPDVTPDRGTLQGTGELSGMTDIVGHYSGRLRYCYEQRMKLVPGLGGRIEVAWSVADGAVDGRPYIVLNTTGDAELAECVTKKISRWEFPADVQGDVSWPFVFTKKKAGKAR